MLKSVQNRSYRRADSIPIVIMRRDKHERRDLPTYTAIRAPYDTFSIARRAFLPQPAFLLSRVA